MYLFNAKQLCYCVSKEIKKEAVPALIEAVVYSHPEVRRVPASLGNMGVRKIFARRVLDQGGGKLRPY